MKFTIETVSKMTGIAAASLRNWEKRYGFPRPERTEGGHRFYTSYDVDFLKKAARLMEEGHCLSQLAALYLTKSDEVVIETVPEVLDDVSYRVDLLYHALLKFDPLAAQMHYQLLNAKISPEVLFDRVFEVLFKRMGADWSAGQISIAQEHYASSFIRLKISSFMAIDFPAIQSQKILAAAPCGESHEGGLLLVAAHLKFRGYPIYYFGVNLPVSDLLSVCEDVDPHVLTLSYFSFENLKRDLNILKKISCPVVLGGYALSDVNLVADMKALVDPEQIFFCEKKVGSDAAHFVEAICQARIF